RPDAIVARIGVLVALHGLFHARDQGGGLHAADIGQHRRLIAVPAPVRIPAVAPHRIAPADHVVTGPGALVLALEHDPAVHRDHAFPASGAPGEDQKPRLG